MPCAPLTQDAAGTRAGSGTSAPEDELRRWARSHVEHIHRLKRDVSVYVLGMIALTAIWAIVEWQDNGAFERLSGGTNPGETGNRGSLTSP